jgi:hypothetical protein
MNKADVISKVSEKTGIAPDACEKVIKAFEEQAGDILGAKIKGLTADDRPRGGRARRHIGQAECVHEVVFKIIGRVLFGWTHTVIARLDRAIQ